ncbi:hypothetical protein Drorol1_Dr00020936 [Drosera rotundifolia]
MLTSPLTDSFLLPDSTPIETPPSSLCILCVFPPPQPSPPTTSATSLLSLWGFHGSLLLRLPSLCSSSPPFPVSVPHLPSPTLHQSPSNNIVSSIKHEKKTLIFLANANADCGYSNSNSL